MPKVALATVGCKVNQYETQLIKERLQQAGCKVVSFSHPADIYIINTCTVTTRADQKSLYLARRALRINSLAQIVITGCMVEAEADRIKQKIPRARIIKNIDKLKVDRVLCSKQASSLSPKDFIIHGFSGHQRAFVKVEDGCNQLCTYCRIPHVRGTNIRSKPPQQVGLEVRGLVDAGYREIVLTGVNLALYGEDISSGLSLVHLLKILIPELERKARIRLTSLEPHLIPEGILDLMASSPVICPHVHLPFQSGDDQILNKMGRKYTSSYIRRLIADLKHKLPEVGITGDIIVGFPGEEEKNFQNTVRFIKQVWPHRLHVFTFSSRHETPAAKMSPQVPGKVKKRRNKYLKDLSGELSRQFIQRFVGRSLPVLVESKKDKKTGYLTGYTHNYIKVLIVPGDSEMQPMIGKIVPVKITGAKPGYALGKLEWG